MHIFLASVGFGLVTASILAFGALGFTLQFGITNVFNLAFGDIMTASALVAYGIRVSTGNTWIAIVGAALAGAVLSLVLQRGLIRPCLRRGTRPFGLVIVTLAAGLIVQNGMVAITGARYFTFAVAAPNGINVGGVDLTLAQLATIGAAVAAMGSVHALLRYTRMGKAMRATASEPELAQDCGIPTNRVITVAWLVSGLFCGLAGVLLVIDTVTFEATTGATFAVIVIAAAIFGGIGEPYGAMLGALVLGLITEIIAAYINPAYKDVFAFAVLVVVLVTRPRGLRGTLREIAGGAT